MVFLCASKGNDKYEEEKSRMILQDYTVIQSVNENLGMLWVELGKIMAFIDLIYQSRNNVCTNEAFIITTLKYKSRKEIPGGWCGSVAETLYVTIWILSISNPTKKNPKLSKLSLGEN